MAGKSLPPTIGRYEVVDRIGHGGMGVVYRARDARIGRFVAIKLLKVSDEGLRDRFLREAATVGRLSHQNIVTVYDFGEHEGQPYIVMEFVEGVTLAEIIRGRFELSLARKLEIVEALINGLDYAHNKGIVHRDIKPANIMIDREDVLKILDFGIARVADSSMTQIGTMMGTPNYMSPEQIEERVVDRRSDIFSVGLVFYELLSYRQAFPGETMHRVLNAIVREMPTPIVDLCPGLDPALAAIVNRSIQKVPLSRYQSLSALADDLEKIGNRPKKIRANSSASLATTVLTPPPVPPTGPTGVPPPTPVSPTPRRVSTNRDLLSKRRAERIERLLPTAQQAFDRGDFAAAIEACDEAALLDPDEPRIVSLLERSRAALDHQRLQEWLVEARHCLEREEIDKAYQLVGQALELDPTSIDAQHVHAAIDEFKRRQHEDQERQRFISAALARARDGLAKGQLESAIRAAGEILTHDPTHQEAHLITREALHRLDERRQQEALNKAALAAVEQQKAAFAAGRQREAVQALERFSPPHEVVTAALAQMRRDLADLERRAAEEEARRRREAAEAEQRRQAQQRWASRQLELAQSSIDARQFADAIEVLRHLEQVVADAPGLPRLLETALAGQAALEAEARRARDIEDKLANAAEAFERGKLTESRALLDAVLEMAPDHAEASARRKEVDAAIAARERAQAIERAATAAVEKARSQFEAGEQAQAIAALESFSPAHALVTRAHKELTEKFAVLQREAEARRRAEEASRAIARAERALSTRAFDQAIKALDEADALSPKNSHSADIRARVLAGIEEERRQAEHERRARDLVVEARQRFAAGDAKAAIRLLERFSPPHDIASEALTQIRAEVAAREEEQRQRAEEQRHREEQQRRTEEEKRRQVEAEREARISAVFSSTRKEMAQGRFAEALERLQRLEQTEGRVPGIRTLTDEVRAAQTAAEVRAREAERRRQQAEEERRKEEARARQEAERKQLEAEARERLEASNRAVARAERALSQHSFDEASKALDEADAASPGNPRAGAVRSRVLAAVEEERRRAEHERRARDLAAEARQRFASGDAKGAMKALERFSPAHPVTTETLEDLRSELKAREEQQRKAEEEARRRAEAERSARIDRVCEQAAAEIDQRLFAQALERLQQLEATEGKAPRARKLIDAARAALEGQEAQAREAKRRQQLEEQAREKEGRERQRAVTAMLNRARGAKSASDAVAILQEALQLDPSHSGCRDLMAARQAEMFSEVERLVDDGVFDRALLAIDKIEALGFRTPTLTELRERAQSGQTISEESYRSLPAATQPDAGTIRQTEAWVPQPPIEARIPERRVPGRQNLWLAGAAAVLVLAVGLGYWLWPKPTPPVDTRVEVPITVASILQDAEALLKRNDLGGAAKEIVSGLGRAPDNTDLKKTLQEILSTADNHANTAKRAADAARVATRPEYASATTHLESAAKSRRTGRTEDAESAVRDYVTAENLYNAAIRSAPAPVDASAIVDQSKRLLAQGNFTGAAHEIVVGLSRAPDNTDLQSTLQEIIRRTEEYVNARKQRADSSGSSSQPDYVKGTATLRAAADARRSGRPEDAEPAVRDYVAAARLFTSAINNNAQALLKQGNLIGAAQAATAGLGSGPNDDLRKTLQDIFAAADNYAAAAKKAADASGSTSRPEYATATARLRSAASANRSGRPEDATAAVRDYVAAANGFTDAVTRNAQALLRQGNLSAAAQAVVAGLGANPGSDDLRKTLQEVLGAAEDRTNAAKQKADASNASGRSEYAAATTRLQAAIRSRRSGRLEDADPAIREYAAAEKLYADATRTTPPPPPPGGGGGDKGTVNVGPIVARAQALLKEGNLTGAVQEVASGLGRAPDNADLQRVLQQTLATAEGAANSAKQAADSSGVSGRPEYAEATSQLRSAATSRRTGRPEDAESAVRGYVAAAKLFGDARTRAGNDAQGPAAIGRILDQYEAAYASLDAPAVVRLDRSQSVATLSRMFDAYRSLRVSLTDRQINIQGDTATVSCVREIEMVAKRGNAHEQTKSRLTVTLRREGGAWSIVSVR